MAQYVQSILAYSITPVTHPLLGHRESGLNDVKFSYVMARIVLCRRASFHVLEYSSVAAVLFISLQILIVDRK